MHGNRDFLIGETFANETGIAILPDPYVLDINNQKVVLSHGDLLCTDDTDYMNFRNEVHTEKWQSSFLQKDINERKQIAASLRDDSEEATSKKSDAVTDVNAKAVEDFINEYQPDLFIHGHTHRPGIHNIELNNLSSKRIVLGDWGAKGWYLTLDSKDPDLKEFNI
jgi:UDP-2,3-diacylglucosamine hydrolase